MDVKVLVKVCVGETRAFSALKGVIYSLKWKYIKKPFKLGNIIRTW